LSLQRKRLAELSIWIFILGIITVNVTARNGFIKNISYEDLFVGDSQPDSEILEKRILVLSDQLFYYQNNRLATPLLDWKLSEQIFSNIDYYENLTWLYKALQDDPPDLIIDPQNYMKRFFELAPKFKNSYTLIEKGKYVKR
jgi:hypothetical protein